MQLLWIIVAISLIFITGVSRYSKSWTGAAIGAASALLFVILAIEGALHWVPRLVFALLVIGWRDYQHGAVRVVEYHRHEIYLSDGRIVTGRGILIYDHAYTITFGGCLLIVACFGMYFLRVIAPNSAKLLSLGRIRGSR